VKARDPLVMYIVIVAATLLSAALIWVLAMPAEPAPWPDTTPLPWKS
jgi:hypothetical protein